MSVRNSSAAAAVSNINKPRDAEREGGFGKFTVLPQLIHVVDLS